MKTKWTKGPWALTSACEGAVVSKFDPGLNLLGLDHEGYAVFMSEHDARLAAAAPSLYEALCELLQAVEFEDEHNGLANDLSMLFSNARDAIEMASGVA